MHDVENRVWPCKKSAMSLKAFACKCTRAEQIVVLLKILS